jgi:hypothetical protein
MHAAKQICTTCLLSVSAPEKMDRAFLSLDDLGCAVWSRRGGAPLWRWQFVAHELQPEYNN